MAVRRFARIAALLSVAVMACAGCVIPVPVHSLPSAPASTPTRSVGSSAGLRVVLRLNATTVRAGSTIAGRLTITNGTRRPISFITCPPFFRVLLVSRSYQPSVPWPDCAARVTIPTGTSSYPTSVDASYIGCTENGATGATSNDPACTPSGEMPALPAGLYAATLYLQAPRIVPSPHPIPVLVEPRL